MRPFDEFLRAFRNDESPEAPKIPTTDTPIDEAEARQLEIAQKFIDALLERVPYWESLQDLSRGDVEAAVKRESMEQLECVTAEHVAEFLYAPDMDSKKRQRPCVLGDACQGRKLEHSRGPITLCEWMPLGDWAAWRESGKLPRHHGPCILCVHYMVNRAWQRRKNVDRKPTDDEMPVIQPHYYDCDKPGEYRADAMIHPSAGFVEGLVRPFRVHDLTDFVEDTERSPDAPPGFRERAEIFFR